MIHFKTICDTRRKKKDGTYPIVFRLTLNRKQKIISTGYSCTANQWDKKNGTVKPKTEKLILTAKRLREHELRILDKVRVFELKHPECKDVRELIAWLKGKQSSELTVHSFWVDEIQRMREIGKHGNARNNQSAFNAIKSRVSLDIQFKNIQYKWLLSLESELRKSGVSTNGIAVYMRTLRAIYNRAYHSGYNTGSEYPFKRYKIKTTSTSPRVASVADLKAYFNYSPDTESPEELYWNIGKLIFLLRGINFTDLALLTAENIKHDRVIYNRAKTHKRYSVKLLPEAKHIIYKYMDVECSTLLPLLSSSEFEDKSCHQRRIAQLRKTTNKHLGKISTKIGSKERFTTYVFRYSHATTCKKLGYSKDLISESLGHAYGLSVSSSYLEDYSLDMIDEMNERVCHHIMR